MRREQRRKQRGYKRATQANKAGWTVCTERCRAGLKTAITQLLFKGPTQSRSVGPPADALRLHCDCLGLQMVFYCDSYSVLSHSEYTVLI